MSRRAPPVLAGRRRSVTTLFPTVYAALRNLAHARMARERPGQTLQPTALVHEVYLRLVRAGCMQWDGRGHLFAAAAEAMRRILVDRARRARCEKHGGRAVRTTWRDDAVACVERSEELLALDEALGRLQARHPRKAEVVKLRYFAGLTIAETAEAIGMSPATVKTDWSYARAWLGCEMERSEGSRADARPATPSEVAA